VLTDRTFLSTPRVMLASFFVGGAISIMFIILFSGIGILGDFLAGAVSNGSPVFVAREICGVTYGLMNLIMMTSSLSTLDSTYTSCAKLVALELGGWFRLKGDTRKRRGALPAASDSVTTDHILIGRIAIVVLAITGCVYLSTPDTVLRATTVSGTMVMGLGPPIYLMLFWRYNSAPGKNDGFRQSPLAFLFSFIPGFTCGLLYFLQGFKNEDLTPTYPGLKDALYSLSVGDGPYRMFFGLNILGHGVCLVGCLLGFAINQWIWKLPTCEGEPTREDPITGERIEPGEASSVKAIKIDDKQIEEAAA
jgi:hypothetical protein